MAELYGTPAMSARNVQFLSQAMLNYKYRDIKLCNHACGLILLARLMSCDFSAFSLNCCSIELPDPTSKTTVTSFTV